MKTFITFKNASFKLVLALSFVLMLSVSAFAQDDASNKPDFSSVATSGQVLYYKIVDYGEVAVWSYEDNPILLGGYIVIPRVVRFEDQNYVVTGISDDAFADCIRIQGVEFPTTMFYIGERAFKGCTDLRVIQMPKTLTYIGASAFEGCTSLMDVVMPNSVVELGINVFKDCTNIRHFVISHGLTEIPEGTFQNCALVTDYFIPANVTKFGRNAFAGNEKLKSVTFFGPVPPLPECSTELSFPNTIPIYVIRQNFDAYKASYVWGQYVIHTM